jgi:hypothetical protein
VSAKGDALVRPGGPLSEEVPDWRGFLGGENGEALAEVLRHHERTGREETTLFCLPIPVKVIFIASSTKPGREEAEPRLGGAAAEVWRAGVWVSPRTVGAPHLSGHVARGCNELYFYRNQEPEPPALRSLLHGRAGGGERKNGMPSPVIPYWIVIVACGCLVAAGCGDPVRTTLQPVSFKVTNTDSGGPAANAEVSLKWDSEDYAPRADERNSRQREADNWFLGRSNEDGKAEVGIIWTVLDRTWGPTPPSWRDYATEVPYVVRLQKDQVCEVHRLILRPGAIARGKALTVCVVEIQPPRYIRTGENV